MPSDWPATSAHLHSLVHELGMTVGAQVAVGLDGHCVIDVAVGEDGRGEAMTPNSLFAVYCTTKPLLALAVAVAERRGQLSVQQQLGTLLDLPDELSRITIAQVLSHTAGLDGISGLAINLVPVGDWLSWTVNTATGASASGDRAAYSEFAGWYLLSLALERATERTWPTVVAEDVLAPLEVGNVLLPMAPWQFDDVYDRLGLNVDLRHKPPIPMLVERAERIATNANAAFGGYATARGLESLYRRLLGVLGGKPAGDIDAELLRRTLQPLRPRVHDAVLGTACSFGYGWMLDLSHFRFGRECSAGSFGHAGNVGMSFAFADPAVGLSVGAVFNSFLDVGESLDWRRSRLVDAIYRDLGMATSPGSRSRPASKPVAADVPVVAAAAVCKKYQKRVVLHDVDLTIHRGELVALLGPNGAGKSTLLDILTGQRKPDGGTATVFGRTPAHKTDAATRSRIGVLLQEAGLEPDAEVGEVLSHVARLYDHASRPDALLHRLGLDEVAQRRIRHLSGGHKRRVQLATALVGNPELLFLDEPTSGIDPDSRRVIWNTILAEQAKGTTILVSTHMVEETRVCSRVLVMAAGRLIADRAPSDLLADRHWKVRFRLEAGANPAALLDDAVDHGGLWEVRTGDPVGSVTTLLQRASLRSATVAELEVERPALEDAYLPLVQAHSQPTAPPTPLRSANTPRWRKLRGGGVR